MSVLAPTATAVVSTSVVPTGAMVSDRTVQFPDERDALTPVVDRVARGQVMSFDARRYAETLFGAEQFANLLLIRVAVQLVALSLSDRSIKEAIVLNGVAVDKNVQAFRRGRQLVAAPA